MSQQQETENMVPMPPGWQLIPVTGALRMIAPSRQDANCWLKGAQKSLKECADRLGVQIEVCSGTRTIGRIQSSSGSQRRPPSGEAFSINSTGASNISCSASYREVSDFVAGKRAEGLIVTITSMNSDRCLVVNDLQILDRGGGWNIDNWVGLDFKNLWRDSFLAGKTNYYAQLIQNLERDRHIPEFHYQIRRPAGELAEYSSTYYLINDYCGTPVRIAVSRVGDWRVIK